MQWRNWILKTVELVKHTQPHVKLESFVTLKLEAFATSVLYAKKKNMNKLELINNTVGLYFSVDMKKTLKRGLVATKLIACKLCLVLTESTIDEVAKYYNTTVPKLEARMHELELHNIMSDGSLNKDYYKLKTYLSELLTNININN